MLDRVTERDPAVTTAVAMVQELSVAGSFSELRTRLHQLDLPKGVGVFGPLLVEAGAQIDIIDGFFNTLETVTLVVPASWYDSDW